MPTLSSSIVKREVASMRDVEEALSRQVIYGGDLATNLLELARVSEPALTRLLAEASGIDAAPSGELPVAPERVRRLISAELALRHDLYPLEEREGLLTVAVSELLSSEIKDDLAFNLGLEVVEQAAPLVRIRQAIARDYGVPLDRRMDRLLAKLEGRADPSPSSMPPAMRSLSPLGGSARPRTVPPLAYPMPPRDMTTSPSPAPVAAQRSRPSTLHRLSSAGARGRDRRRMGPYTAAMAERDLMAATSREDVLRTLFDFAAQYFEYSALFVVQGDLAEGRDARGPGADRARVTALGVPLDLPSALASARRDGTLQLVRLGDTGIDATLAADLERSSGTVALILPISVRGRCVLILYGDHGDVDVELGAVGDVLAFAGLVSNALEQLILRKKTQTRGAVGIPGLLAHKRPARLEQKAPTLPALQERARALAGALTAPQASSAANDTDGTAAPELDGAHQQQDGHLTLTLSLPPTESFNPPAELPVRPSGARAQQRPPVPESAQLRASDAAGPTVTMSSWAGDGARPSAQPALAEARSATPPHGTPRVASDRPLEAPESPEASPPPPRMPSSEPPPILLTRLSGAPQAVQLAEPDLSEIPELAGGFEELTSEQFETARVEEAPLAVPSRRVAFPARRPRPRQQTGDNNQLPTVIVNLTNDCQELVKLLLDGDPDAADRLLEIGEPAVSALVAVFPGPLTGRPKRSLGEGPARASDHGPVLRTLKRIGPPATPFLIVRANDIDPHVRSWAVRLLGELPGVDAAEAVVRRLIDLDPDVRRAALAAARMMQGHVEARAALRIGLLDLTAATSRTSEARRTAIEALAELRDAPSVPKLVALLKDSESSIVQAAHWALTVITRQDFGHEASSWEQWWQANGTRHRIEWLIEALMHDLADIRRVAGDELKNLTKEYFGYYDDLPKKERARAQQRYREWWEKQGRQRFS